MIVLRAVRVDDETGAEADLGEVRLTDTTESVFAFAVPGDDRSGFVERLRERLAPTCASFARRLLWERSR